MSRRRLLAAGLALVGLLSALSPAGAQDAGPIYVVQDGDTLIGIASRFGTSVDSLATANALADPSAIFPGMRLVIPGYEGVQGVLTTRPVQAGENLRSLSFQDKSTPSGLGRLNRLVSPDRLYVGQPLIVAVDESGASPPQAALQPAQPGVGLVSLAVGSDRNPWLLAAWNGHPMDLWLPTGDPLFVPADAASLDALPGAWSSIGLRPERPEQGHTLAVRADVGDGATIMGRLGEAELHFESDGDAGQWVALQGIHALAEPGLVDMVLTYSSPDGPPGGFTFVQPVRIDEGEYGREILTVPPETIDPANTMPEDARIAEVVAAVTPQRLWSGPFQFPTTYFETFPSFFGTRRNYNSSGWKYYHTGLDLYGSSNTEILAPAAGVVAFAESLTVRGNTTYIDHGWGVYTGYLHQSQILVQPGDRVEPGQRIGMVGGTGRVTGPHLHWEIWVGGVPVQPLEWTASTWP